MTISHALKKLQDISVSRSESVLLDRCKASREEPSAEARPSGSHRARAPQMAAGHNEAR